MGDTLTICVDQLPSGEPFHDQQCQAAGCTRDADSRIHIGGVMRFACWQCLATRLIDMFP